MKTRYLIVFFAVMAMLCVVLAPNKTEPVSTPQSITPNARFLMSIGIPLYAEVGNVWAGAFTEPFESAYFLFKDGTLIRFTNHLESMIFFPDLEEFFETYGLEIKDLLIVVHNHLTPNRFSSADIGTYHYLKKRGFVGHFGIYYPFSKKIIFYNE